MAMSGIHTISLFDNNDDYTRLGANSPTAGTVVQINNILDNQGSIKVANPLAGPKTSRNEEKYAGDESALEIWTTDDTVLSQIQDWMKADNGRGRRIQCVGAGFQENLLWQEPTRVRILPKNYLAPGNLTARIIRLDFAGGQNKIGMSVNLLDLAVKLATGNSSGWSDVNPNNNVADGYISSLINPSFTEAEQISDFNSSINNTSLDLAIIFPIANIELTISEYTLELTDGTNSIRILQYDYNGNLIYNEGLNLTLIQRNYFSTELSSGVYKITARVCHNLSSSSGKRACKYPALRTDGSSDYIAG